MNAGAQNAKPTGDARDVRILRSIEQEPLATLLGQPSIALWKENHLVVAYLKGIPGKADMGSIDAVISTNDGDSWSIPITIFDHTESHGSIRFGYANPVL